MEPMTKPVKSKYSSTLTPEQVAEIRVAPLPTRHADLARRFNVSPTTVARIRKGQTWNNDHETVRVRVASRDVADLESAARAAGATPEELLSKAAARIAGRRRARPSGARTTRKESRRGQEG